MNEYERLRRYAESLREQYPAGTRILVNSMYDDPRPLPPGSRGTVSCVDDMGTIHVNWDNGRALGLVPEDSYRKLTEEELAEEDALCQTM